MLEHKVNERARVNVAYSCSHHETFSGSEPHGCIHAFSVDYSCYGTAVADVAGDFLSDRRDPKEFTHAL